MKILGMDIGSGTAVCTVIDTEWPDFDHKEHLYNRDNFLYFKANPTSKDRREGWLPYKEFLKMLAQVNVAVMEPTGTNYSRLWSEMVRAAGVEMRMVGHNAIASYRATLKMPDKQDDTDALTLALYCQHYYEDRKAFVIIREKTIQKIREIVLRLDHLNRVKSPIINRLRQQLAWQLPELQNQSYKRPAGVETVPIFLEWLAGNKPWKRYEKIEAESLGAGIQDDTRRHAQRLIEIEKEEAALEKEMKPLLKEECFRPYIKVFTLYGFNFRMMGIILSQIYPLENFLGDDGKPEEVYRRSTKESKRKTTKRHLSRRRFEKILGVAPTEKQSGSQQSKRISGGSGLCRKSLWQWIKTRVEPMNGRRDNPILNELYAIYQYGGRQPLTDTGEHFTPNGKDGTPYRLRMQKTACKAVKMLWKDLVKEITQGGNTNAK